MIDEKERTTIQPDISRIGEVAQQVLHDAPIVLRAVYLLDKDFLIFAIPSSGPVFIGPVETKGEITIRIVQVAL